MTAYSVRCSLSAIFARQLITHLNSHTDDSGGKIGAFKFIKNRSIVYNCHKTLQVAMPSCIQALLMLTISIVGGQRNDGIPTRRSSHQSNQPMLHQRKSFEERKKPIRNMKWCGNARDALSLNKSHAHEKDID